MLTIGTLFSGIESPIMALQKMGIPHRHLYSCEVDAACQKVIRAKYSPRVLFEDIYLMEEEKLKTVDVLVAGLPCQSFSHIGKMRGFKDERGNLFMRFAHVLAATRPRHFIMENVSHLLEHDDGRTYDMIWRIFNSLRYETTHSIVNSIDFGIPQNRKRVYVVGGRKGEFGGFESPPKMPLSFSLSDVLGGETERTHAYTLRVGGRRSGYHDRHNWDEYMVDGKIARLTVAQACRLQGFPSDFYDDIDISESDMFKQLGNTMTVDVIGSILKTLFKVKKNGCTTDT